MDLQSVALVTEIIGAIAVVLTLVVLVVSIRQNTRTQKSLAVDSLAAAIAAINVPAIESPAIGNAVSKATADWRAATREERMIAFYFLFSLFKLQENAWYQYKANILDEAQWQGWEKVLRKYYHSKGVREVFWPARRAAYSQEFQEYLASSEPPEEIGSLSDLFDDHEPK